jgi:Leucine-rich repeat (LRR) protein
MEVAAIVICHRAKQKGAKKLEFRKMKLTEQMLQPLQLVGTLTTLSICSNNIATFPAPILQLTKLVELDVSHNSLTEIPVGIGVLQALTHLDISSNRFDYPPIAVAELSNLKKFEWKKGNPWNFVPRSVLKGGTEGLLSYLSQLQSGSVQWNSAKLLVVGEENVGKTTLLHWFENRKVSTEPNLSTDGISVKQIKFNSCLAGNSSSGVSLPVDSTIEFSAWDFGGQEVFYPTHQV